MDFPIHVVQIGSIKFWLNASIPQWLYGYTKNVPGQSFPGMTMIPGPVVTAGPVEALSACYLTDQRTFSNSLGASSRMHSEFTVVFQVQPPTFYQFHRCNETIECNCAFGAVNCRGNGSTSRMNFRIIENPSRAPVRIIVQKPTSSGLTQKIDLVTVSMHCSSNNPCAPSSRFFGDIDIEGIITLDQANRSITFNGLIDAFPAFEAYASINGGPGIPLFRELPSHGKTVMNLPGFAASRMHRRLVDRDGDGVFETLETLIGGMR